MYAARWQVSVNYRIDGGTRALSAAALSPLNAREQIENGSIHADLHDVLSIKLHIHCLIFEIEDTITQGVCFLWAEPSWVLCCIFGVHFDSVHTVQL